MKSSHISIVIPAYNESAGIAQFHRNILTPHLDKMFEYDIIYINDGSRDNTLEELDKIAKNDTRVRIINLSRNFGKEMAITAGIHCATGDAIVTLDADGQHPPELISEFIKRWQLGAQVVVGVRASNTSEGIIKKWGSKVFYRIFNSLSGTVILPGSTDFRLIDREVQAVFMQCTERSRITRGLIDWLGFTRDYIYFDAPARLAGNASYSSAKLVSLAMNSFVSLSLKPLFMLAWIGLFITLLSFSAGIFMFIEQFLLADPLALNLTGAALLGIFISFLIGLVLTSQGVIAVYVSHIHTQAQGRPLFIIDKRNSIGIK